jgi:hypothetical protein
MKEVNNQTSSILYGSTVDEDETNRYSVLNEKKFIELQKKEEFAENVKF